VYQVIILPKALNNLSGLDKSISKRIIDKLTWLSENAETITPLPLSEKYAGFFKLSTWIHNYSYVLDIASFPQAKRVGNPS
jgi:mRNA-degrading endonuclease RelE of RelBE toxin-antitoxin system